MDLKHCITHQLDPTNDLSDVDEGEEAMSLISRDTDVDQNLKCDSYPYQENENIKHPFQQKCKSITKTPSDMRNEKTADEK